MIRSATRLLAAALLCGLFSDSRTAAAEPAARAPNVLFIAIDDLNDWVGCLAGHPQARTPHIDRLAARGTLFTHAYCAAPACNPSRAALLSGRRPSSSGVYHNNQPWRPALRNVVTLPEHLRANGYRVVAGGKIFHGAFNDRSVFDEYHRTGGDPHPPVKSASGLNRAHFDWSPVTADDSQMADARLVDWAAAQLAAEHSQPLFLGVGFVKPHLPWYVPQKYFDLFPLDGIKLPEIMDDDLSDVPAAGVRIAQPAGDHKAVIDAGQYRQAVQGYLASIAFVDAQVGRLIDALDKTPRGKETIVVLWGDHGWHLGEKHHWRKFALWEDATHAPLIFVVPGITAPGTRCETPVDFMSIYPTLAGLCRTQVPEHVEGVSLLPLLQNPEAKWDQPALTTHGRGNHAVRMGTWRYIRYQDGSEELYNQADDPHEWRNLAGKDEFHTEKSRLAKLLPESDAPDAPPQQPARARRAQRTTP